MPGSRNRTGTDPSLNHPLTMSYMGAGSGWGKRLGRRDFHAPPPGEGRGPEGARGGSYFGPHRQPELQRYLSCACAKALGAKLLFKGDDFAHTDVARARGGRDQHRYGYRHPRS
jgi:hypothetical protein